MFKAKLHLLKYHIFLGLPHFQMQVGGSLVLSISVFKKNPSWHLENRRESCGQISSWWSCFSFCKGSLMGEGGYLKSTVLPTCRLKWFNLQKSTSSVSSKRVVQLWVISGWQQIKAFFLSRLPFPRRPVLVFCYQKLSVTKGVLYHIRKPTSFLMTFQCSRLSGGRLWECSSCLQPK